MNIAFIGSGNTAYVLSRFFHEAGHRILQVISPHKEHARQLAEVFAAGWSDDPGQIDRDADVVILAVTDAALPVLNAELRLGGRLVVHTAGGVPMQAIAEVSRQIGVFYPLQTLSKSSDSERRFPVLLETNDPACRSRLDILAGSISDRVIWMSSDKRLKMHVAGVFCNNFVHWLAAMTENFCRNESLDFSLLEPLLEETLERIKTGKLEEWQTGPARRGDRQTLAAHEKVLEQYPDMQNIYRVLSEEISKRYRK